MESRSLVADADSGDLTAAIVAADPLVRAGLANLLAERPGVEIVGQYALEAGPPAALAEEWAQVLLIDLGWEGPEDTSALNGWIELEIPILLLVPDDRAVGVLWGPGVRGLLGRERTAAAIVAAARAAIEGLYVLDPEFSRPAVRATDPGALAEPLTPRETEVLQLLAAGQSNRAIAHELSISEHTVKFHVTSILGKLGAESRTEAAVMAARAGLIVI